MNNISAHDRALAAHMSTRRLRQACAATPDRSVKSVGSPAPDRRDPAAQ